MTTIPAEPTKRHRLTQEDCDTARLLMARQRTLKEIAEIIGVDPSTVGKIRLADFNLEKYLAQRKAMNEKTREKKNRYKALVEEATEELKNAVKGKSPEEAIEELKNRPRSYQECLLQLTEKFNKQLPGQIQMELPEAEEPKQDDQTKMMRFFAAQVDKIAKRLDVLIDVLQKGGGSHE